VEELWWAMTEGEGVYVPGVEGEEPVVLNTGPLGGRVYWDGKRVRRMNPTPKSLELQRVETLGQTFFSAANPSFATATFCSGD
jgi:hypothetical protein